MDIQDKFVKNMLMPYCGICLQPFALAPCIDVYSFFSIKHLRQFFFWKDEEFNIKKQRHVNEGDMFVFEMCPRYQHFLYTRWNFFFFMSLIKKQKSYFNNCHLEYLFETWH